MAAEEYLYWQETKKEDILSSDIQPDAVFDSLGEMGALLTQIADLEGVEKCHKFCSIIKHRIWSPVACCMYMWSHYRRWKIQKKQRSGYTYTYACCIRSSTFTIISKYGFEDVVCLENIQADAARVASNIVTGVSFLGAGLIFVRGDKVQGLTTAAGIWVTAAVGLTIGCGMYTTGFFVRVLF